MNEYIKTYYYVLRKSHHVQTVVGYESLYWCEWGAKSHAYHFKSELRLPVDVEIYVICKNGVHRKLRHYFISA